jgi:hypothetical protein
LNTLYQQVLGRAGDTGGLATYQSELEGSTSLVQVRADMAVSPELINDVTAAYTTAYGSGPSQNTLLSIENQLATATGDGATGTTLANVEAGFSGPLITNTVAAQSIAAGSADMLFAAVTVTDPVFGSETATITLLNASSVATDANGVLSGAGLTEVSAGVYSLTASTAANLTTGLHNLVFTAANGATGVVTDVSLTVKDASANVGTATTTAISTQTLGLSGTPVFIYSSVANDSFNGTVLGGPATPADIFSFTAPQALGSTGNDTIANFNLAKDMLQFSSTTFANAAAVLAATTDTGGGAVIQINPASSVTLVGVTKSELSATNFYLTNT